MALVGGTQRLEWPSDGLGPSSGGVMGGTKNGKRLSVRQNEKRAFYANQKRFTFSDTEIAINSSFARKHSLIKTKIMQF